MKTLNVELGARSYPIYIGTHLLQQADLLEKHLKGRRTLVVSNTTVAPLYLQALMPAGCEKVILPDGEQYKTLESLNQIFTQLLEKNYDRQSILIALGGGVIGDITGFASACYQRGIRFIQIPTTLLAQVDSSVGGKTGVNHALGKNMVGAFHQPVCVIADTVTLRTLPKRELSAGMAEIIKYGLIHDGSFFNWLEEHMDALLARDETALAYAIEHSCRIKAEIVAQDERESGVRALLNFGHTFGHAIETFMHYKQWLHGEAVGCGMLLATALSVQLGWLETDTLHRVQRLLNRAGLPLKPPANLDSEHFIELMQRDKKVLDGKLRLILLRDIGRAVISDSVDRATLQHCLRDPLQVGY